MSRSEIAEFAEENIEMLSRVLACGDTEAQGYALALLAEAEPDAQAIERVEEQLEELKRRAKR